MDDHQETLIAAEVQARRAALIAAKAWLVNPRSANLTGGLQEAIAELVEHQIALANCVACE